MKRVIAAEHAGSPFLLWRAENGDLRITVLDGSRWRLTVGRGEDSDVPLAHDAEVSRTHALLELIGGEWTIADDGLSRNGTFINASRMVGRHRLQDGDRLCFGSSEVMYREAAGTDPVQTMTSRDGSASFTLSPMQRRVLIALCRPVHDSESATPAPNRAIADEVFLSVDAVKAHLRVLFDRFGLSDLPQNEKRAQLVARALVSGMLSPREF